MYIDWLKKAWGNPNEALKQYPFKGTTTPHYRLIKAIVDKNATQVDIVCLIRAVMRFEEVNKPKQYSALTIPKDIANGIDQHQWAKCSIEIIKQTSSQVFLRPKHWNPFNKSSEQNNLFDAHALSAKPIRKDNSVEGDPFLNMVSFERYQSNAQREAVRSIFCSPPGETIVINLPTGTGKSLCAFLPSILPLSSEDDNLGVTPIVVPTVSLALDMAKKLEPIVGHDVAYRPEDQRSADIIRIRCKNGLQGPVIVSPESLVGSLSKAILTATAKGYVRYFIIDEAHMVLSWGDEFRPGFQLLSSLRKEMLSSCCPLPFKTILMSATFTQYHLTWLKSMFSERENFSIIHAVNLRPEPSFWQLKASDQASKKSIVFNIVCHLPKPIILYSVTRQSAKEWFLQLKQFGFNRVERLHGQTSLATKKNVLQKWNNDQIDIMVATSAFGLGVDKPNVRAVIHVEIPETVDRFYQDVGRGGRDGFGCISFLCWCDEDRAIIYNMQNPKFIGLEKGLNRWTKMFDSKKEVDASNRIYEFSLETPAEIDMQGEYNRQWNLRTLLLLERSRIIRILALEKNKIKIKILQSNHTDMQFWKENVDSLRKQLKKEYEKSSLLLENLLQGDQCLGNIFSTCYTSDYFDVPVVRACSGCHSCRKERNPAHQGWITPRRSPKTFFKPSDYSQKFKDMMGSSKVLSIYYPDQITSKDELLELFYKFLRWVFEYEIVNLVAFPELNCWLKDSANFHSHWKVFLNDSIPNTTTKYYPTIYILKDPKTNWWPKLWKRIHDLPGYAIVMLPNHIVAPDHPGRKVRSVIPGKRLDYDTWEDEYLE